MKPISNIAQFLEGKTVLITGATGFLAKILLEKMLRVQPNIGKIFLLIRAESAKSSGQRLRDEILETDLFRALKMKWGETFSSFIAEKAVAVPGDISFDNLGIQDPQIRDRIQTEVDVLINSAAITKFDERYDVAIDINTVGALHVVNFARKCMKLKVLLHVSTAYVCKESAGVSVEEPLWPMPKVENVGAGDTTRLDINAEKRIADAKLREMQDAKASPRDTRAAMKDLGIQRARMHGWPNTYVFTKAMGEMLLEQFKGDLETVIVRPTIISSTYKEPFPGWIEGVRTMDSILVAYGKGNLKCFIGHPQAIMDVIPGDMVVNAILAAITAHANESSVDGHIYHVGSSRRNPLTYDEVDDCIYNYFTKNPWFEGGKPVLLKKPKIFTDTNELRKHISTRYMPFSKVLMLLNILSCRYFETTYTNLERKINSIMQLAKLYQVYLVSHAIFDDANTETLRIMSSKSDLNSFNFDIASLEWKDYLMNTHIPNAVKYLF